MTHALFMIVPIVLIAISSIHLIDSGTRRSRLFWSAVFAVAIVVLLVHIGTMESITHNH
jgi:heme A synthase